MTQATSADTHGYAVYTLTDTAGRIYTITGTSLAYQDANGVPQAVSWAPGGKSDGLSTKTLPTAWYDQSCVVTNNSSINPAPYILFGPILQPIDNDGYLTITYPQGSSGGQARSATIALDPLGNILAVVHPEGGYTKFSYTSDLPYGAAISQGPLSCVWPITRVSSKAECDLPSNSNPGSLACKNPEVLTKYAIDANGVITVIQAAGTASELTVQHNVTPNVMAQQVYSTPEYETSVVTSGPDGPVKTIRNNYSIASNGVYRRMPPYPDSVTVTDSIASGTLASVTNFHYENPIAGSGFARIIQQDQLDYDGTLLKSVQTQWMTGGSYSTALLSFPQQITEVDSSGQTGNRVTTYTYDSKGNVESQTVAGTNATTESVRYVSPGITLDAYGRPQRAQDGLGNITKYQYGDSWADSSCAPLSDSFSYLTSVTNALNQTTSYTYYSCTGALATVTDPNGQSTGKKLVYRYDPLGRNTNTTYPNGGSTQVTYDDGIPNWMETTKTQFPSPNVSTRTVLDGLGRPLQNQLRTDPDGIVYVDMTYDELGRLASTSNPYRSKAEPTYGVTQYLYDALGRKTQQIASDGISKLWWCYNNTADALHSQPSSVCQGNGSGISVATWVDSVDENGNHWQHASDALGRLRGVVEPYGYKTTYSYDALGDLLCADQWGTGNASTACTSGHARSFTYDALSHLLTATNRESGTTTYLQQACVGILGSDPPRVTCNTLGAYDADGNLLSKTDARGVISRYTYDALNRLIVKGYANDPNSSPWSCYSYDSKSTTNGIGRLTARWTQKNSCTSGTGSVPLTQQTFLAYDPMGRVISSQQCVWTNCTSGAPFSLSQTYDLAGNPTFSDNGMSGYGAPLIGFGSTYDGVGRLKGLASSWVDATHPATLFSVQQYTPAGGLQNWTLGNNLNLVHTYDSRLRVTSETATVP